MLAQCDSIKRRALYLLSSFLISRTQTKITTSTEKITIASATTTTTTTTTEIAILNMFV
jgi:hypothetical protein